MSQPPTRASAVARDPAQGPWARSTSRRNGARPRPESRPITRWPPSCAPARHPPPRANLPPRGFGPPLSNQAIKNGRSDNASPARRVPASQDGDLPRNKSIAKGNRNGHPTGRARYSRAPQMAATAGFDASFCHSPGLPLSWAGAREIRVRTGRCFVADRIPGCQGCSARAMAARSGWRAGCAARRGARSKRRIAATANRVLCSRRLYIVQSGQR
jgi:hypothetical protein